MHLVVCMHLHKFCIKIYIEEKNFSYKEFLLKSRVRQKIVNEQHTRYVFFLVDKVLLQSVMENLNCDIKNNTFFLFLYTIL